MTWLLIKFSEQIKFFPSAAKKYFRKQKISRFGGVAIIISFLAAIFLSGSLEFDDLKWGIVIASVFILLLGLLDDIKNLSWKKQILTQIAVALIMIYYGLQIDYIANPFGGAEFRLDSVVCQIAGNQYYFFSSIFVLFLIVGFMNIINWLDGLDGLAGGMGIIGFLTLFFLSISSLVNQPPLGIISISLVGAILGFLIFNFYPARIFMGTSGSMFIGFSLATISIFSGAKLATLVLVLTIPILDALWVIVRRIKNNKSIFQRDKSHLHYRLAEFGFSQNQIAILYCAVSAFFGFAALKLSGAGKITVFIFLAILAFFLMSLVENRLSAKQNNKNNET